MREASRINAGNLISTSAYPPDLQLVGSFIAKFSCGEPQDPLVAGHGVPSETRVELWQAMLSNQRRLTSRLSGTAYCIFALLEKAERHALALIG